jgi:hypothetical protein
MPGLRIQVKPWVSSVISEIFSCVRSPNRGMEDLTHLHFCLSLVITLTQSVGLYTESTGWFIESQVFSQSYDSAPHPARYLLKTASCFSFWVFLCVVGRAYWRERGGGCGRGGAESHDPRKAWSSVNLSILSGNVIAASWHAIHESAISLRFMVLILGFLKLEVSAFVFVFLQNVLHEQTWVFVIDWLFCIDFWNPMGGMIFC